MPNVLRQVFTFIVLAGMLSLASSQAGAITVELAKKCREMSFKAHPPQLTGTKKGTAAEQRKYYAECIQKDGNMPDSDQQSQPANGKK